MVMRWFLSSYPTRILLLVCLGVITLSISCSNSSQPQLPTVDGPEDDRILEKTRGHVVFNDPNQELIALSLPNLEKRTIRHRRDSASIYAVAGPDQSGRIVYVENHMMTKTHLLKLMDLVGSTDTVI